MDDDAPAPGTRIGRILLFGAATLGMLFSVGVAVGLLTVRFERGEAFDGRLVALLAGTVLFAAACGYVAYRALRAMARTAGGSTSRERRSHAILAICGALGGLIGATLSLSSLDSASHFGAFTNDPLPAGLAIALAIVVAVVLPILSVYWHRRVADEQEAAAYAKGALIGIYVYWIGAPTWWLLWRGGIVPAPDGIAIYFATIAAAGLVWFWAKYR